MSDTFETYKKSLTGPANRHFAIAPSDGADLPFIPRAIFVNAGGTLAIRDENGDDITYNVSAGSVLPFRAVRVLATGTTATAVGWY